MDFSLHNKHYADLKNLLFVGRSVIIKRQKSLTTLRHLADGSSKPEPSLRVTTLTRGELKVESETVHQLL